MGLEEKVEGRFAGFPSGELRVIPLPNVFFTQVLPHIDSLAELKATLHLWWLLHAERPNPRGVALEELLKDGLLLRGLKGERRPAAELAREGIERALARGTFLQVKRGDGGDTWLFANDEEGRRAAEGARSGERRPREAEVPTLPPEGERPNIFALYEQNVGLLQPLIADELREAEESYPAPWIEEAFRIAAERNVRNWRYIRAILERWKLEGKDDGTGWRDREKDRRRYIEGEFADYIEH